VKKDYIVPPNSVVKVDTASPRLPAICSTPLILEAESIQGVRWKEDNAESRWELKEHNTFVDSENEFGNFIIQNDVLTLDTTKDDTITLHVFKVFDKADVSGQNFDITWSGSGDSVIEWSARIFDGAYDAESPTDFPPDMSRPIKGKGPLGGIINVDAFDKKTQTLKPNWTFPSMETTQVTLFVTLIDSGDGVAGQLELTSIEASGGMGWNFTNPNITFTSTPAPDDFGNVVVIVPLAQLDKIIEFLDVKAIDEDNGDPIMIVEGDEINATNNAPSLFRYENASRPTETEVEFFAVDLVGNNSTCTSTVLVRDTTKPVLEFATPDLVEIIVPTDPFSETARITFDEPILKDLPEKFGLPKLPLDNPIVCAPLNGSSFSVGTSAIACSGTDNAGNVGSIGIFVNVTANTFGVRIKNVTASDDGSTAGLSDGDTITVTFTMPTNQPPVSTTNDINSLFNLSSNYNLGNNVKGEFVDPSNLVMTILDSTSANLTIGKTMFEINEDSSFTSASGIINNSRANGFLNPIVLSGDFSIPQPPFITALIADDPSPIENNFEDNFYSDGDTITIRLSEPTNTKINGKVLDMNQVDALFDFSPTILGNEYEGTWIDPSTFIIKIIEATTGKDIPKLGVTKAKVVGDVKNKAETSAASMSISPLLDGSFGALQIGRVVEPNGSVTATLPSGLTFDIVFPDGTARTTIEKVDPPRFFNPLVEVLNVFIGNTTDCEMGCKVTYYFNEDDLKFRGFSLDSLLLVHDRNNNDIAEFNEFLKPLIKELKPGIFSAEVTIDKFSSIGLGERIKSGGGGGDETPPSFKSFDVVSCDPVIGCGTHILREIEFINNMPTATIPTGHTAKLILRLHEDSGPNALQHVTFYTNIRGWGNYIQDSDTFIRYDKGKPITIKDPHGFFADADISVKPRLNDIDVIFSLTFDKPLQKSDVIIRVWDQNRNSKDATFKNSIMAVDFEIPDELIDIPDRTLESDTTIESSVTKKIPQDMLFKWAGYSDESVSDSEILEYLGIEGGSIPSWYKNNASEWLIDEKINQEEFVNALKFFANKKYLVSNN